MTAESISMAGLPEIVTVPKKGEFLTYIIFIMLGTGTLLPWNVFITETVYFGERFKRAPYISGVADNYEALITVSFQLMNISAIAAVVYFKVLSRVKMEYQIAVPLLGTTILIALTCAIVWIPTNGNQMAGITLLTCMGLGLTTAVLNGGVFGLGACLPPKYIQAVMAGQGWAGVVVALTSVLTTWIAGNMTDLRPSAFAYFVFSLADLLVCVVGYYMLFKLPFFLHHYKMHEKQMVDSATSPRIPESDGELSESLLPPSAKSPNALASCRDDSDEEASKSITDEDIDIATANYTKWLYRISVWLTFTVTLSVFPSITSFIKSTHKDDASDNRFFTSLFVPFSYVVFNAGDLIGRTAAGSWPKQAPRPSTVFIYAISRVVFIPLLMMCNVVPPNGHWPTPLVFKSDFWPILFNLLLAMTNGHLGSVCMMHAPSFQPSLHRAQESATMSLALTVGITLGCCISLTLSVLCQK